VGFNPSTQRHYRWLIYYLNIHSNMFWTYDYHQAEGSNIFFSLMIVVRPKHVAMYI
jgi:hypothetical protein